MKRKKNKYPGPSLRKAIKKIRKGTFKTHSKMIATSAPGGGPPSNPIGILEARPASVVALEASVVALEASVVALEGGHTIEPTPSATHEEKKVEKDSESVAGFIFMCSGKTKPECYRYRVFGLPMGKLEVVKKVKPGAKLFLFDFDLKLLYGVYEATSGGDLDIEPMAFDRKFPSQVRFRIFKECLPVPESVFKEAIEDNYVSRSKFRQELNRKQVRSLVSLYRPIDAIQPSSVALPYETIRRARPAYAPWKHLQPTAVFPPPGDLYLPWRQHTSSQAIPRRQYECSIPRVWYEQYGSQNHMGQIEPVMESRYYVQQLALPPKGGLQIFAEVHQPYFPEEPECSVYGPYRSVIIPSQPASYAYKELQLAYQPHYNIASHDGPAQADAAPLAYQELQLSYQPHYNIASQDGPAQADAASLACKELHLSYHPHDSRASHDGPAQADAASLACKELHLSYHPHDSRASHDGPAQADAALAYRESQLSYQPHCNIAPQDGPTQADAAPLAYKELQLSYHPHYNIASHDGPSQADAVPLARKMHETVALCKANLSVSSVYSYPAVAPAYR